MPPEHVTILTSCTASKRPANRAYPAEDLYTGQQHLRLMHGVRALRDAGSQVDVWIVSAGHGVVHGSRPLESYERTFQGRSTAERRDMAASLNIPEATREAVAERADLVVVLLSEEYLDACRLTSDLRPGGPMLVVCSVSAALRIPTGALTRKLVLRTAHTRSFRCGYVGLKGEVVGRLLSALAEDRLTVSDAATETVLSTLAAYGPVAAREAETRF